MMPMPNKEWTDISSSKVAFLIENSQEMTIDLISHVDQLLEDGPPLLLFTQSGL